MTGHAAATDLALAALEARWGAAAPRRLAGLAAAPLPAEDGVPVAPARDAGRLLSTGFPALDGILGPGGLPRGGSLALAGEATSGRTTLALRLVAEAQAAGSLVAWLDLAHSLDAVEAAARGVDLAWLVALVPDSTEEGLAMAGALLQGRAVDLLVLDLPERLAAEPARTGTGEARPRGRDGRRAPSIAERLDRLGALARRNGTSLVVLAPPGLPTSLRGAIDEATGLRLGLERRGWIRLGRDVVGQRIRVAVERNRFGPPGRWVDLRILYADGGDRDACLRRPAHLAEAPPGPDRTPLPAPSPLPAATPRDPIDDATPPSPLVTPPPPARPGRGGLRLVPDRADRPGRPALGGSGGPGRGPGGDRARGPARDGARDRAPARPGGDLPGAGERRGA